jgi:hypothetical protein
MATIIGSNKKFPPYRGVAPINIPKVRLGEANTNILYPSMNIIQQPSPYKNNPHIEEIESVQPITSSSTGSKKLPYDDTKLETYKQKEVSSSLDKRGWIEDEKRREVYIPGVFWLEDSSALFETFDIIPNADMNDMERLNAMTRAIIIISAIMFVVKFPAWWVFLVFGIIVVIILWFIMKGNDHIYSNRHKLNKEYLRKPKRRIINPANQIEPININRNSVQNQNINLISIP